jgi:hypothetical protein
VRDRDVRNAIKAALDATNMFDPTGVQIFGLPEYQGLGASVIAGAFIEPHTGSETSWADATEGIGLYVDGQVRITLAYRGEDPQLRDEAAELLLVTVCNALNGEDLGDMIIPDLARVHNWEWLEPTPPERRIRLFFRYRYLQTGWDSFDDTP